MPRRPLSRVVYFHSVDDRAGSTPPTLFRQQLELALTLGFRAVTIQDLLRSVKQGRGRGEFAVTFDDGYADNVDVALPILLELGVPATFYVVSGLVGNQRASSNDGHRLYPDREMLSAVDLRTMAAAGMEIGSHSRQHHLASTEAETSFERYVLELRMSRKELEAASGAPVKAFAYPNGQRGAFSATTRRAVVAAGFSNAATTIWGSSKHMRDSFSIPRCELRHDRSVADARSRLLGRQDYRRLVHLTRRGSSRWGGTND